MVLAMSRMLRGLEEVRRGARHLLQRSATWAPPELEGELSPLPASAEIPRTGPVRDAEVEAPGDGDAKETTTPHDDIVAGIGHRADRVGSARMR